MHSNRLPYKVLTLSAAIVVVMLVTACTAAWNGVGEPRVEVPGGDPLLGRQAIQDNGCISCHSIPGVPRADAHVGPPLDSWSDRAFIAGRVENEPETLVLFLLDPKSVDPESAMPVVGLTEEDARDIASYLYTLDD